MKLQVSRNWSKLLPTSAWEALGIYLKEGRITGDAIGSELNITVEVEVGEFRSDTYVSIVHIHAGLLAWKMGLECGTSGIFEFDYSPPSLCWKKVEGGLVKLYIDSYGSVLSSEFMSFNEVAKTIIEAIAACDRLMEDRFNTHLKNLGSSWGSALI